eukprot:TRINITY_DN12104_c0_g1_i3.p1 TRINITY_DN12104_c0_g1~~TRINITY_DN12104_c0_g1_i3.p1  ORF type:complete len:127 (-),score=30.08 TRINITY_DN12104_c0_g1_i3:38-418(-)
MSMFKRKTPYQKGMQAIKERKFGIAKKELIKATQEGGNSDAHDKLGVLFFREGDYDNAQQNFEQALGIDPECGDAMHHMSVLLYTTERRDEAVAMCQDAPVSYTHLRAHETVLDLVCRLLLEKKNT